MNPSLYDESDKYLNLDQLLPLENPEETIKKAGEDLKSTDWSRQFDSCNTIRRACAHHSAILASNTATHLHSLILDLVKIVESLRSSLVKNCILALIDLIKSLKKALDPEVEVIIGGIIKKGLETGSFLGGHVHELLAAICEICSESRIVSALLNILGAHKSLVAIANPPVSVKLRAIMCIEKIINKLGNRLLTFKDNEKIINLLGNFLSEGSLELRKSSKRVFMIASKESSNSIEFERLVQRSVTESIFGKIKDFLKKDLTEESDLSSTLQKQKNNSNTLRYQKYRSCSIK